MENNFNFCSLSSERESISVRASACKADAYPGRYLLRTKSDKKLALQRPCYKKTALKHDLGKVEVEMCQGKYQGK